MHVPTLEDVMAPFRHLPVVIQEAVLRVETHPSFSILTRSQKKVLKSLVSRMSKNDGQALIKIRLDIVADTVGVHYKTVQRALLAFRTFGWLEEVQGGRNQYGVFTSCRYQFSATLCALVGLQCKEEPTAKSPHATKMSSGTVYVDLTFKKDQQRDSAQKRLQNPSPVELPPALKEIIQHGIKDTGIAKLRGLAHSAGYKLEDVWTVAKPRITDIGISGVRLYRYLETLIAKSSDYAARARKEQQRIGVVAGCQLQATQQATPQQVKARSYANRRYAGPGGTLIFLPCGMLAEWRSKDNNGAQDRFFSKREIGLAYEAVENGKVKEIVQ